METPVSPQWISFANAAFPRIGPEEAVEIRDLIRMPEEPIDFLEHKVDENLAAALAQNLFDQAEGVTGPPERIDEGESRNKAAVPEAIVYPRERR
jgi:hypothetical protein